MDQQETEMQLKNKIQELRDVIEELDQLRKENKNLQTMIKDINNHREGMLSEISDLRAERLQLAEENIDLKNKLFRVMDVFLTLYEKTEKP